jgi:hypothetical protein
MINLFFQEEGRRDYRFIQISMSFDLEATRRDEELRMFLVDGYLLGYDCIVL